MFDIEILYIAIAACILVNVMLWFLLKGRYERKAVQSKATMMQSWNEQKSELEKRLALTEAELLRKQADIEQAKINSTQMQNELCTQHERRILELNQQHEKDVQQIKTSYSEMLTEQEKRFLQVMDTMSEQLKTTTDDMLKKRQGEFQQSNAKSMSDIVDPLKTKIKEMQEAMDRSRLEQTSFKTQLKEQVENLIKHSEAARKSADTLSQTLSGGNKIQGDWGEHFLKEIFNSIGLVEGRHYDTQVTLKDIHGHTVKNDEDHLLRPDAILHLDQKRDIIIDAKVSMTAYKEYSTEIDEKKKEALLQKHIESIRQHVAELSKKDYSRYISSDREKMDYVIMFVPHIGALWTALDKEPTLWRNAMQKNVFIADEQTLYAALRIIDMTWKQIAQAQNHQEVFRLAGEIVERVGQFYNHFKEVGKKLTEAQKGYEATAKKLEPGGQSIIQSANKLINMGARPSTNHPLPATEDKEQLSIE
ncbi:MAG: DNA recombination protein RmuC [Alistipes sp.]|nr:DNA recombination protein RmuC [Candidatus Alistipes equi]